MRGNGTRMLSQTITISNKLGLHARASAKLVSTADRFQSEVVLNKDGLTANAKSIMGVMMLAAGFGTELKLTAEGPDSEAALKAVVDLFNNRFGEPE